jgi:hypothetical protein
VSVIFVEVWKATDIEKCSVYWSRLTEMFRMFFTSMLQAARSRVRFPMRSLDFFFNLSNPSNRTMVLGSTQPLTEMSTRNFPGG